MKSIITIYCLLLFSQLTLAQNHELWTSFWNEETNLMGFKSPEGKIMIQPKLMGFTVARSFDKIIAVMEENNGNYDTYYLTKAGKKIGYDSLHIIDNSADCESEGFIRFRDKKTDQVGMFDKNGTIVIPAIYNALSRTHNGLISALKGAEKKYWDKHNQSGCNHYSWQGGQNLLMDIEHNILVENFKYDKALNFFSIKKTKDIHSDAIRQSFVTKKGGYYSFVVFEKEFKQWLTTELLEDLTVEKLISASYNIITWQSKNGWKKTSKTKVITDNFTTLKNGLLEILNPKTDYFISTDGLNPFMYEGEAFKKYYNNCGESKDWIYPTMSVIINHKNDTDFTQNTYQFLRTDNGYKLISLDIRDHKMK